MTTKKAAIKRAESWKAALREHRVVNFGDGRMQAFPTAEKAKEATIEALKNGFEQAYVVTDYPG